MRIKKAILPVLAATAWIAVSEFIRNQLIFNSIWVDHYKSLGIVLPSAPINGALWGVWSLMFAIAIYVIAQKFTLLQTTFLAWLVGFAMMWVVIGNLGVLPIKLLWFAIPLSLFESFGAAWMVTKLK